MKLITLFFFTFLISVNMVGQHIVTDSTANGVIKIFRQDIDFFNVLDSTISKKPNARIAAFTTLAFDPYGTSINYFLKVRVDRSNKETAIAKLIRSTEYYKKQFNSLKKYSNSKINATISQSVTRFNNLVESPKKIPKFYITVGNYQGGITDFRSDIIIPLEYLTYPKIDTVSFADSSLIQSAINENMLGFFLTEQMVRQFVSDPNSFSLQKLNPFSSKGYISVTKIFSFFSSPEPKPQPFSFGNNNLADAIIKSGISFYIAKRSYPDQFSLIQERLHFDIKENDDNNLWKELIKILPNKDEATKIFYTSMESHAKPLQYMLGTYFGLLIVNDYMENTKVSIDHLLDESDYQKIFEQSGWKAKTEKL